MATEAYHPQPDSPKGPQGPYTPNQPIEHPKVPIWDYWFW
jgi:hypothetical protein